MQVEKTVPDTTDEYWDPVTGVNCRGVFHTCRAVLPRMTEHGVVIVNIGSVSGKVADPSMALYNASKAFVSASRRTSPARWPGRPPTSPGPSTAA
ncbi:SDR family NAD(P)-dependent oxidoreductase [Streptomyces sp. HNM0574]|uniref:SDR family NAD(P)-dependent oxidoreductase n=1 Tax=Streptomyces sp. HNM0574 TaxID=2714954 RepID=UPI0019D267C0